MQEIFKRLEFRPYLYEEDSEPVADMHCSAEVLEGFWFDKADNCKLHAKLIARCPGSSWVLAYGNIIFAHADFVKQANGELHVICARIHENYMFPQVMKALLDGIRIEALKRKAKAIVFFADNEQIDEAMKLISQKPDRTYSYVNVSDIETGKILRHDRVILNQDDIDESKFSPFIGIPYPPSYFLNRAYAAADYALFRHEKPQTFDIYYKGNTFFACYDGREWCVFKRGDFKSEKEAVSSVLKTISELQPGRILLSEKALEAANIAPANDKVYHDYYISI